MITHLLPELVAPRGGDTRALRAGVVARLRAPMIALLDRAPRGGDARLAQRLARTLEGLSERAFVECFDHPLAWAQLAPPTREDGHAQTADTFALQLDAEAPARALGLARFLVGAPALASLSIELTPRALPHGELYLPHLHVVIRAPHVVIEQDEERVRVRLPDRTTVALPRAPLLGVDTARVYAPPLLGGLPSYHGIAEVGARLELLLSRGLARRDLDEGRALAAGWRPPPHHAATLAAGRRLLAEVWPDAARAADQAFQGVVCLPHAEDGHFFSLTTGRLRNVLITGMVAPAQVGDSLVHEGAHTRLWPLFDLDPLLDDDGAPVHRSPWRRDLRPLKGLLNGVHAFTTVVSYYRRLRAQRPELAEIADEKLALHWPRVLAAWEVLAREARPTPLGAQFLALQAAAIQDEAQALELAA